MQRLKVDGMSCDHCVAAVQAAIRTVDPAAETSVDLANGLAIIHSTAPAARLIAAIAEEGYEAHPLPM